MTVNEGGTNQFKRITIKSMLHEVWHAITHVEDGLSRTIVSLAVRPGKMMQDYLHGNRKIYQKPVPFLLLATTLYALTLHFIHYTHTDSQTMSISFHERLMNNAHNIEQTYYSWIHLALMPVYSVIAFLLFRKARYYYAEWLVICCYIISFLLLVLIPYEVTNYLFDFSTTWYYVLQLIIIVPYSVFALNGFLKRKINRMRWVMAMIWAVYAMRYFIIVFRD